MSNLLEIKNLKKYFSTPRGELHAVDNVNLNIEKGKTIGVVGDPVVENLRLEKH